MDIDILSLQLQGEKKLAYISTLTVISVREQALVSRPGCTEQFASP